MTRCKLRPKKGILLTSQAISDVNIVRYHSSSEKFNENHQGSQKDTPSRPHGNNLDRKPS